jgi:TonB family protein
LAAANKPNTVNINEDDVNFSKLYFTISKTGEVRDVHVDKSCGYEKLDNGLIWLIKKAPGKWIPARTGDGQATNQTFHILFGSGDGC